MGNRAEKYVSSLAKCRKNIEKTKGYIEYHKKMLRIYEAKESRLVEKLEDQKIAALRKSISKKGLNIDDLCNAVANGNFQSSKPAKKETSHNEMYSTVTNTEEVNKDEDD